MRSTSAEDREDVDPFWLGTIGEPALGLAEIKEANGSTAGGGESGFVDCGTVGAGVDDFEPGWDAEREDRIS